MSYNKKVQFIIDAQDNASSKFKSLEKQTGSLSKGMQFVKSGAIMAAKGVMVLGGALSVGGGYALKSAADMETMRVALKTAMGGSIDAAKEAEKTITSFAAKTPYQLGEVMSGFIKLKNMGLDPGIDALTSYGDTASSMGKGLNEMVEAVADAATGEFERLKEFGIRASQEGDKVTFTFKGVSTTVGKNSKEIENYLIKLGQTNFGGGMEAQSQTLSGMMSTLKDNFSLAMADMAEKSGLLQLAKDNIQRLVDITSGVSFEQLSGVFNSARDAVKGFFVETNVVWVFIRDFLAPIIMLLKETFTTAWNEIVAAIQPIKPELKIIAQFFGVLIVGAIMVAVLALAELIKMATKVVTGLINIFSGFIQWFRNGWTAMVLFLTGHFSEGAEELKKSWNGLKIFIKGIAEVIFSPFSGAFSKFKQGWRDMFNSIVAMWNDSIGKLNVKIPNWVPKIGGKEFSAPKFAELRAAGGPVSSGSTYIVGERGPEVFVPNQSGTIIPNHAMGGTTFNFTFNGDISDKEQLISTIKQAIGRELELSRYGIG